MVTAYTQAALLTGRCLAGVTGQVLIATEVCDYYTLNFVSLAFVTSATAVACFLPSVSQSIYFHRGKPKEHESHAHLKSQHGEHALNISNTNPSHDTDSASERTVASVCQLLWVDFKSSFSNAYMLKWSIWY